MTLRVLIIDDDVTKGRTINRCLARAARHCSLDVDVDMAESLDSAMLHLRVRKYDLVLTDWDFPTRAGIPYKHGAGEVVVAKADALKIPIIVVSGGMPIDELADRWVVYGLDPGGLYRRIVSAITYRK